MKAIQGQELLEYTCRQSRSGQMKTMQVPEVLACVCLHSKERQDTLKYTYVCVNTKYKLKLLHKGHV